MSGMDRAWKWIVLLAVVATPWLVGLDVSVSVRRCRHDRGKSRFWKIRRIWGSWLTGRTLADPQVVNGRRPVVLATYFLDRALYGLQPAGWRVTSLLLHLGCVALADGAAVDG